MDILEKIVINKRNEVAIRKQLISVQHLEGTDLFHRATSSLKNALTNSTTGIIAEYKRRSPSKSVINQNAFIQEVAMGYNNAGVCGMSVLTEGHFFGGSLHDLLMARGTVQMPLLRKEFIIDEYQIIEAKAHGADVILLIAAILTRQEIAQFARLAHKLHMEVLLEVHNEEELNHALLPDLDMIGVNNRNLKTFEVSIETSTSLASKIPSEFVKVSESGISSVNDIQLLRQVGYRGFLMGETFMASENPGSSASEFCQNMEQ